MPDKNSKGAPYVPDNSAPATDALDLLHRFSQVPANANPQPEAFNEMPVLKRTPITKVVPFTAAPSQEAIDANAKVLNESFKVVKAKRQANMDAFVKGVHNIKVRQAAEDEAYQQQALIDARATHPGMPDEALQGFTKMRADALRNQVKTAQDAAVDGLSDDYFKTVTGLKAGENAGTLAQRKDKQEGSAFATMLVGDLAARPGMDQSFVYDKDGKVNRDFKAQVVKMTGGDPKKFKDAAQAIIQGKVAEYDAAPSIGAQIFQSALDYSHDVGTSGNLPALGIYYALSGVSSGTKAALRTGATLGHIVSSVYHGAAGDLEAYDKSNHYGNALADIEAIPDKAKGEQELSWETFANNPFNAVDALLGSTARFGGEVETLGGLGRAVGAPIASAVENAGIGTATEGLAKTAANRVYPVYAKALDALGNSRIPGYLDNVLSTSAMFGPSMYGNYYADALKRGYTPAQADEIAAKHVSIALPLMAIGNLAGPTARQQMNKVPKEILDAMEHDAPKTFFGQAQQIAGTALKMADAKEASKAGLGMGASAFADAYQEHQEAINAGHIDPNTPFDAKNAIEHAVQAGVIGALTTGVMHLANGHGNLVETPQAMAIYQAAQNPAEFYRAVDRQQGKGAVTPEQAQALKGYIGLITERSNGKPSLIEQGFVELGKNGKPTKNAAAVVKWATEQARRQEVAGEVAKLAQQMSVVKVVDDQGIERNITYGIDPQTGIFTEAAGAELQARMDALNEKAAASDKAISQLKEGSYVRGRTIKGDELLRITGDATPDGKLTTQQAGRILGEGPYTSDIVDIAEYANDPQVKEYMDKGVPDFSPQHANDPIIGADGSIIDGKKRIALALSKGQTAMPVVRPVGMHETAQHAQEARDNTLGSDAPIVEGLAPEGVEVLTHAKEAYDAGLERTPTEVDAQLGLSTPGVRALHDAAEVLRDAEVPKEQIQDMLNRVTGGNTDPSVAEHITNVATGSRAGEVIKEVPKVEAVEPSIESTPQTIEEQAQNSPTILGSVLAENGKLREDVTPEEVENYLLNGDVPERLMPAKEVAPKAVTEPEVAKPVVEPKVKRARKEKVAEIVVKATKEIKSSTDKEAEASTKATKAELVGRLSAIKDILLGAEGKEQFKGAKAKDDPAIDIHIQDRLAGMDMDELNKHLAPHGAVLSHDKQRLEIVLPNGNAAFPPNAIHYILGEVGKIKTSDPAASFKPLPIKVSDRVMGKFDNAVSAKDALQMAEDNLAEAKKSDNKEILALFTKQHEMAAKKYEEERADYPYKEQKAIFDAIDAKYEKELDGLNAKRESELEGINRVKYQKGKGYKDKLYDAEAKLSWTDLAKRNLEAEIEAEKAPYEGDEWIQRKLAEWDNATPEDIETVKEHIDNGAITEGTVQAFTDQSGEGLIRSEPIVEGIESKAESDNEAELTEAIAEADKFIQGVAGSDGRPEAEQRPDELPAGRIGDSEAGQQAPPLNIRRGQANIFVEEAQLEAAGWSEPNVRALHSRLQDMFGRVAFNGRGVTVAIVGNKEMQQLTGRAKGSLPDASYRDGVVYINVEHPSVKPSAALHESGHMWVEWSRTNAKELHSKGIDLAQQAPEYQFAIDRLNNPKSKETFGLDAEAQKKWLRYVKAYAEHSDVRMALADEVLAQSIQQHGRNIAKGSDIRTQFTEWLQSFWDSVKGAVGFRDLTARKLADLKFEDFTKRVTEELGSGKALTRTLLEENAHAEKVTEKRGEQVLDEAANAEDASLAIGVEGKQLKRERDQAIAGASGKTPVPIQERVAKDPLINTVDRIGASGIIEHWKASFKGLYNKAIKEIHEVMPEGENAHVVIENALSRPAESDLKVRKALGISVVGGRVVKLKGDSIAEAIFQKAADTFSATGKKYTAEDVANALKRSAEIADANEEKHQQRVQVGKENQKSGLDTGEGKDAGLVKELADGAMDDFQSASRMRRWAKEKGITEAKATELVNKALNLRIKQSGDMMHSLPEENKDERQAVHGALMEAAKGDDLDKFATEALQIVRNAYQEGYISREEAGPLARMSDAARTPEAKEQFLRAIESLKTVEQPTEAPAEQSSPTGIRNKIVDAERAKRGLSPAMKVAGKELGRVWDEALAVLDKNPNASENLLNELRTKVRPLTDIENGLLLHRQITAQTEERGLISDVNELSRLGDILQITAARARLSEVQKDLKDIYDLGRAAGSANSAGLRTRQLMAREDYTLAAMESREEAAQGGKPLSEKQKQEIADLHEKIATLQKEYDDYVAKTEKANKKKAVDDKVSDTAKEAAKRPASEKKDTSGRRLSVLERMKQRRAGKAAADDSMYSLPDLEADYEPVLTKEDHADIRDLMRIAAEEGITEVEPMVDRIHMDLSEFIPDLTKSEVLDAMSEYGKTTEPSKDEVAAILREIKAQGRLMAAYRDATNSKAPAKSGFQRGKPSDEVRELKRKLTAAMEASGITVTDPAKQLATRLEAAKSQLKNQIADIQKAILTRERPIKPGKTLELDAEGIALKAERDRLQTEFNNIFGKKEISDEKRVELAMKAIERSIKEYERKIDEGDLSSQSRESKTPNTPELIAAKAKRDELVKQLEDMRNAANPPKTAEEKALDAAKKATEKSIEEYERRLLENDLNPVKKAPKDYKSPELDALRKKRDDLKDQIEEARKRANPPKTPQELATEAAIKATEKSIKDYEQRLQSGNPNPSPKTSKVDESNPELIKARAKRDKLKQLNQDLYDTLNPPKDPFDVSFDRYEKMVNRRKQEYEDRIRTNNFAPKPKNTIDLGDKGLKLSLELEKAKYNYEVRLEKNRLAQRTRGEKIGDAVLEAISLPKALLSTFDASAPLRQGAILSAGNPRAAGRAFVEMFKQAFSKAHSEEWLHALHESDIYPLIRQSGLYIAEPSAKLRAREEQFMSHLPDKVPIYKYVYGASERAYTGYLNKIRADVFTAGVDNLLSLGMTFKTHPQEFKAWADFINNATGRGGLGKLEVAAPILNSLMFSPRMLASRLNLMNPVKYATMPPQARIMAMRNMLSFLALGSAVLTLAALSGADVEDDPRSADFGKIKSGDTRYDIWSGFIPIIRTISQIVTAQRKSTTSGNIMELDGKGRFGENRTDPALKFMRSKLSPAPSSAVNLMIGKDVVGNDVTVGGEALKNVIPLYIQDIGTIINDPDNGGAMGIAQRAVPAFFGVGVQSYKPKK